MKLLSSMISEKMSKLIPMVLVPFISLISFSLVTGPNAFATQVWESSIAKFMYPDNWKLVQIIGNGVGIYLQPINEPNVHMVKLVFQDSDYRFDKIVEDNVQLTMDAGYKIKILKNVPGEYIFSKSGFNNGIHWKGWVIIQQVVNTNDVGMTIYTSESSKFFVYTYLSPQEVSDSLSNPNPRPSDDVPEWDWV